MSAYSRWFTISDEDLAWLGISPVDLCERLLEGNWRKLRADIDEKLYQMGRLLDLETRGLKIVDAQMTTVPCNMLSDSSKVTLRIRLERE